MAKKKKRIGIFSGTFDPVHAGHLAFALQAIREAKLDQVYFLPERQPRNKPDVEHFGHRTAMITRAIRPHEKIGLLELPDIYFDVSRTLPKLQKEFAGAELVFLMGSDSVVRLNADNWPNDDLQTFLSHVGLAVGMRSAQQRHEVDTHLKNLPAQPLSTTIFDLPTSHISSSHIRHAFRHGHTAVGLLASVRRYARANWLYVSLAGEEQAS